MENPKNTNQKTVAIGWVQAIVAAAMRRGIEPTQLLTKAGLGGLPADPLARVPLDAVVKLWQAAADLTGDPAFGLRMGQAIEPTSFNVVAYTLISSTTLREAFGYLQRFQRLVSDGARLQLVEQGGLAWLIYHPIEDQLPFVPLQVEAVLACAVRLLQWVIGPDFKPTKIWIVHQPVSPFEAYREVLGCEPMFGQTFSGVGLPLAMLDTLLPARNRELCQLHESLARRHLLSLEGSVGIRHRVVTVLRQSLPQGLPQKEQVAAALGMSGRTLQQRLAEEGTSFVAVLDDIRHKLALEYLAEPALNLAQIATMLDFSDASAFYRAFRRWTGVVPGEYRRAMTQGSDTRAPNNDYV